MGAAMVSLVEHAHADHSATATAWGLSGSAALVLAVTALLTINLQVWREQPRLYRPLASLCVAVAILCLGLGIAMPTPLVFSLSLVGVFSVPWQFAVAHRVTHQDSPSP
jgi:MFS-type transporter involved in bile tolerance (Atg22 family)